MRHLTASESIHDNLARDAAIAEMGRRLAAQGLRARQRQRGGLTASRDAVREPAAASCPAPQPVTRLDALAKAEPALAPARARVPAAIPWARTITLLRRITLLGATAACGFSLVLYAENLRVAATLRSKPAPLAESPMVETLAAQVLPAPPAERVGAEVKAPAPTSIEATVPVTWAPVPQKAQVRRALPPKPVLVAHAGVQPRHAVPARAAPHVVPARFELPRWLTERRVPSAPRTMSEPPHDLTAPVAVNVPASPRAMYALASASFYPLPPLRRPGY